MKSLMLSYKHWGFIKKNYKGELPENWDDLNATQLTAVAEMYMHQSSQLNALAKLICIPETILKKIPDIDLLAILDQLTFMTDFRPRNCFIIQNVNSLTAPRHKLDGMSWEQFIYVDSYYEDFVGRMNVEGLNIFVAHLYLRKNEAFDHSLLKERATQNIITKIPYATKYAIAINYRLIREWLGVVYGTVFQKKQENNTPEIAPKNPVNVWIKIHQAIVGDNLADYEKYAKLPLHVVLRYLTEKIKENARKKY